MDRFADRLLPGEAILWRGQPGQGILFSGQDWFLIPSSLLWCGFAIFWETGVVGNARAPVFMKLWGAAFVLVGLFFVFGRFVVDSWVRRGTYYALSDKRILILRDWPTRKFSAVGLDRLPDASLTERADGRGTIRFGQQYSYWNRNNMSGLMPSFDPTPQFITIQNVREVFAQIQLASHAKSG